MFADHKIPIPESVVADHPGLDRYFDKPLIIGVRPSSLEDAALAWASELPRIKAEVAVTEELGGSEVSVIFPVATAPVLHDITIAKFDRVAKDHAETRSLAGEGRSLWTAQVDPKTSARSGRTIELTVDACSLYWFDRDRRKPEPKRSWHRRDNPQAHGDSVAEDRCRSGLAFLERVGRAAVAEGLDRRQVEQVHSSRACAPMELGRAGHRVHAAPLLGAHGDQQRLDPTTDGRRHDPAQVPGGPAAPLQRPAAD
ncbi:MAG TPA: hypothetical protein VHM23_20670, partial [Actinomycetota bacterium]|nr:hypothetical protein [Actinomycetota bacterium]